MFCRENHADAVIIVMFTRGHLFSAAHVSRWLFAGKLVATGNYRLFPVLKLYADALCCEPGGVWHQHGASPNVALILAWKPSMQMQRFALLWNCWMTISSRLLWLLWKLAAAMALWASAFWWTMQHVLLRTLCVVDFGDGRCSRMVEKSDVRRGVRANVEVAMLWRTITLYVVIHITGVISFFQVMLLVYTAVLMTVFKLFFA